MRVSVVHRTRLDYSEAVVEDVMDTRLGPHSDAHQRWERHDIQVTPFGSVRAYVDGFGNAARLLSIVRSHTFVEVTSAGIVETLLTDPFASPAVSPRQLTSAEHFDYLKPSRLISIPAVVRDMAEPHRPSSPETALDSARALMELVYSEFSYEKDVTTVTTTVPEVVEARRGVCQDFAHVLISLYRAVDIPARYVSGYIVSGGGASRGARASHAWVDAWIPTHGWRGFDPTNNLLASEHHVKMAIGRDYGDVPPTRGTFRGSATEKLSVEVSADPID
jgi:transglutaminase-like putative cysteine protease